MGVFFNIQQHNHKIQKKIMMCFYMRAGKSTHPQILCCLLMAFGSQLLTSSSCETKKLPAAGKRLPEV